MHQETPAAKPASSAVNPTVNPTLAGDKATAVPRHPLAQSEKSGQPATTEMAGNQPPARSAKRGSRQATPYQHGKGWCMRKQYEGHELFVSGCKTQAQARKEMAAKMAAVDRNRTPVGAGPKKTSLAQALQDYAMAHLPFLRGADQESRRINAYLRAAGLQLLKVTKVDPKAQDQPKTGSGAFFHVELVPHTHERVIPNGLHQHRKALLTANARTDKYRAVLACTPMQDITRDLVQQFIYAMRRDRHSASTIALERAVLRSVFNHAYRTWRWNELHDNPATQLKMPKVDNERKRVLSVDEQVLLEEALEDCRNARVAPALTLLRETAMRASEPLVKATWRDVDWQRCVITVKDAKNGTREVPLSPAALEALRTLGPGQDDESVVGISYEALSAAWNRACKRAGISDLHIHDLRHTAATRMALATGNVFLVKALTGHKTLKMLERYVNVSADDVVKVMHGSQSAEVGSSADYPEGSCEAPATTAAAPASQAPCASPVAPDRQLPSNVIRFPVRRAA